VAADTTGGRRRLTPGAPAGRSWDVRDLTTIVLLGILPCLAFLYYLRAMVADGSIGDDFEIFWRAGSAILHGDSPYPPPDREVLASEDEFVYPAPAGLTAALFAWLPTSVAEAAFLVLLTGAVVASSLSPIVWSHYWVLLLAPLALARPRWSPLWLLPIAFSILPGQSTGATPWEPNDGGPTQSDPTVGRLWIIATGIAIAAVTVALSLRASPRDPTGVDTSGPTR
jgi:hypothetical protein